MRANILLVDDEQSFLDSAVRALRLENAGEMTAEADPRRALELAESGDFDVAFLDVAMPGMDGMELLEAIKRVSPRTECVMVTAHDDVQSVIRAVKLGAYDYLVKPIQPDALLHALRQALEHQRLFAALETRRDEEQMGELRNPAAFGRIITADERLLRVLREGELHAASDIPVLIVGETGSGKELLARAIHDASPRAARPFVAVNMLSLSPSLFESEFFGHAKGAFTGALADRAGYLENAQGGTLFLDEIGDLPMEIQGKLLRILQEGEFTPVGKTTPRRADVRFVAATNQDLQARVEEGVFRKDLYYRLRFAHLTLPPLRERKGDVRLLAEAFVRGSSRPDASISEEAMAVLMLHDWPGNVRELKGAMEAAANLAESGVIEPEHLHLEDAPGMAESVEAAEEAQAPLAPLAEIERRHILAVYHALDDNKTHAARRLGISLATLQRKLKAYGVS